MNKPLVIACLSLLVTACGGDVDLTGIYLVTHHTQSLDDCTTEGTTVDDPPYFQMANEEFLGYDFLVLRGCTSAEASSCSDTAGMVGASFAEPIDNGWRGRMTMASGFGDPCSLTYAEATAILADDSLRVEVRNWGEEVTVDESECEPELAEERGQTMPCIDFQVIVGTLVEE